MIMLQLAICLFTFWTIYIVTNFLVTFDQGQSFLSEIFQWCPKSTLFQIIILAKNLLFICLAVYDLYVKEVEEEGGLSMTHDNNY